MYVCITQPSQAQHTNGAVELATVMGTVELCISDERLIQSVKLTGLKVVFDEVIRHVAESLALNEAREGRGSPVGVSLVCFVFSFSSSSDFVCFLSFSPLLLYIRLPFSH